MNFDINYRRNLIAGSVISILILAVTTTASWISIERLMDSQKWVDHTNQVILTLENTLSRTKDAETGQRGYLLTGQEDFLAPYNGAKEDVWDSFGKLGVLTADNAEQQKDLSQLSDLISYRFQLLERSVDDKKSGHSIDPMNIERGRVCMIKLRNLLNKMEKRENILLTAREARLKAFSSFTPLLIILASLLSITITIVFYLRLKKGYQQKLLMQEELIEKEKQIAHKIDIINEFAGEVAQGNYKKKIDQLN